MSKQRTYFRATTAQQRKLLFETWQSTRNVSLACRRAQVSRQTFYNWKSRFEAGGDAALEKLKSHAPKQPRRTPDSICEQIILMRQHHPDWGKRRIAADLKKSNGWVALVSPNTVRRILIEAGMWEPPATKKLESAVRTAEMPGQTVNVDLCFVPLTHLPRQIFLRYVVRRVSWSSNQAQPLTKRRAIGGVFLKMINSLHLGDRGLCQRFTR